MDIFLANEQDLPVDHDRLSALASHAMTAEDVDDSAELSVLFVSAEHMRRLNSHYAGDDFPTDVLSFPLMEDDDVNQLLGDVVICPVVAKGNADKLGHPLDKELETLLVHGALHLLGYDHQGEHDGPLMETRQREILESFDAASSSVDRL